MANSFRLISFVLFPFFPVSTHDYDTFLIRNFKHRKKITLHNI